MKPTDHILANIDAVRSLYQQSEQSRTIHQRAIEEVTAALGRPLTVYLTFGFVVLWVVANQVLVALGIAAFDPPPYHYLQGVIGLGAILMTTAILITGNRDSKLIERRSHLELQVNLLAEKKIAKIIALLEELRRDIPTVKNRSDHEATAMSKPADPEFVVRVIDERHLP